MNTDERQPIDGYPKYEVDRDGTVWNVNRGNSLKPYANSMGYKNVTLSGKSFYLHRVVAKAFIPNPLGKPYVNHIDGNPNNNHVDNLEWCTRAENDAHSRSARGVDAAPAMVRNGYQGRTTIYIQKENWLKWDAIENKSAFVNRLLEAS